MPQLTADGLQPRVALPGAVIQEGKLHMHSGLSGSQREYQIESQSWQVFKSPLALQGHIRVRANVPNAQLLSQEQTLSTEGL